ncbi:helix-turn-helix transcriptional regulator [Pseudomonas sp. CC120222-01a]|uniref:helix-turn-helix transcriptional regulator n=1 Tax=Pseudomonas sp. CC120222-01a TaxID=1378075 RepID=UPI000DA1BE33|nr:helix-turn-helix transcriptional regulator [Pseudomonas sp. CC120222-01a]
MAQEDEELEIIAWCIDHLPNGFQSAHCAQARARLDWSVEALSFRSGVSRAAIRAIENGAELRPVTMQALAFAFEAEGLIFLPGHPPMTGENCRGSTRDPRSRRDYHLLE